MIDLLDNPAAFLQRLVLMAPALLLAITVHEVSHGWVADRLGDSTARMLGRLTLNPIPHIDPFGALAFVLAGFGWAKPVPVNARNLRQPRRDMLLIAAAGPVSNFVLAFVGLVVLTLARRADLPPFLGEPLGGVLWFVFQFNLALAIFNLIPLPPLDGGHFLPYFLPREAGALLHQLERYGPLILLGLLVSGATRYVIGPIFGAVAQLYLAVLQLLL